MPLPVPLDESTLHCLPQELTSRGYIYTVLAPWDGPLIPGCPVTCKLPQHHKLADRVEALKALITRNCPSQVYFYNAGQSSKGRTCEGLTHVKLLCRLHLNIIACIGTQGEKEQSAEVIRALQRETDERDAAMRAKDSLLEAEREQREALSQRLEEAKVCVSFCQSPFFPKSRLAC
jgi:hypothetical protein